MKRVTMVAATVCAVVGVWSADTARAQMPSIINKHCKECQYYDSKQGNMVCVTAEQMGAIQAKDMHLPSACKSGFGDKADAAEAKVRAQKRPK